MDHMGPGQVTGGALLTMDYANIPAFDQLWLWNMTAMLIQKWDQVCEYLAPQLLSEYIEQYPWEREKREKKRIGLSPLIPYCRICPQGEDTVYIPTKGEACGSTHVGFVSFNSLQACMQHLDLPEMTKTTMIKTAIATIY